jgi:hypothetical protein
MQIPAVPFLVALALAKTAATKAGELRSSCQVAAQVSFKPIA